MTAPRTLDELAIALSALRAEAGSPSYAEIARRIAVRGGGEPAKVTVYDCFRQGRRRIDPDLIGRIVRALGEDAATAETWREAAAALNGERQSALVPVVVAPRGEPGHRIGRERDLELIPDADVIVLTGLPGVGKSTLASALVDGREAVTVDLRESDPDQAPAGPVEVLRRVLGALGLRSTPYDLGRLRERAAQELAGRILVLEDAGSVERLGALLLPGVRCVVTARAQLHSLDLLPGAADLRIAHVEVTPLDDAASLRLLTHLLADDALRAGTPTVPGADALRRIVAVSGGLPLDIAMLAGVVREHRGWTFDDLASRFESESRDVRIRPVLEAATRALSGADADLLADAALLDREIDVALLAAVHPDAPAGIARLRARHLVDRSDGGVQMHATVFAFVRDRSLALRPESERRESVRRFAVALQERLTADPDAAARDIATVRAVAEAARAHGLDAVCERLAVQTRATLGQWTLWDQSLHLHDLAARGRDLTDIPDLALGIAHSAEKLGRFDEALVILHRVRRVAAGAALARTWNQIGNVQRWMGRFDDALTAYRTAIGIARQHGDAVVEGRATGNHADTLRILARYPEAASGYAEALAIATAAADEINVGIVRANRTLLQISTGQLEDAERELAVLIAEAGERTVLHLRTTRALLREARGDDTGVAAAIAEIVGLGGAPGEYGPSADLLLVRARLLSRGGRDAAAADVARRVLEDAQRSGSPLVATDAANTLAEVHLRGGDPTAAQRCAREAIGTAEVTGDRAEVARGQRMLADAAALNGEVDAAASFAAASRAQYRAIGHRLAADPADDAARPPIPAS